MRPGTVEEATHAPPKHESKKLHAGRGTVGKVAVAGAKAA